MSALNMRNTTLCYLEQEGKYLMLHRITKAHDMNHDKWIGIGGKFEEGESPEDCLQREVFEETGLFLDSWSYRGIVTFVSEEWGTEYMHLFLSNHFHGLIKECEEGVLEWIDKRELLEKEIWEGDRVFLNLLDSDTPFFSLKLCYSGDHLTSVFLNGRNYIPEC